MALRAMQIPPLLQKYFEPPRNEIIDTPLELCGFHYENSQHFLLHCTTLQETRKNVVGLQQPFKESIDETIFDFLLFKENSEEIINRNRADLQKLWQHRLKIIHTNVNQNQAYTPLS